MKSYNPAETVRFMLTVSAGNIIYIPDEELIGRINDTAGQVSEGAFQISPALRIFLPVKQILLKR